MRFDVLACPTADILQPLTFSLSLYTAFSFAMNFSFFGSYQYVYSTVYGFDARQVGLCYIPVMIGEFIPEGG